MSGREVGQRGFRRLVPRTAVLVAALVGAAAIGACSDESTEPQQPEPRPTAADQGAELFESPAISAAPFNTYTCATCHAAAGSPPDDLVLPGAPLAGVVDRPSYWGGAEVDLLRAVNHCLKFFMLQDEPWTGREPEAIALYAYLESLSKDPGAEPEPVSFTVVPEPVDLPDGDAARGRDVFTRACEGCHGEVGTGASKGVDHSPTLPDDTLAAHPEPEYTMEERRLVFVFKIRHGAFMGHEGQMPPFSTEALSDADMSDLLALLFAP